MSEGGLTAGARSPPSIDVQGYVVGERIGAGGFGEVFGARHAVLDRDVAIKVLHARYSADEQAVARFVAEARAVNRISHPGIVQIVDFGALDDGRQYYVMERLRGTTLRDVLRRRTRLPLAEALPILRGIADAVDAAHAAGIAHRDLKPDNVFVLDDGGVKLIDFGLAKLTRDEHDVASVTRTGAVFGTPLYMSPEQCRGKAHDVGTDHYSFGALAYHVLTGAPPWTGEALDIALHHLNDAPERPSVRCSELGGHVDAVLLALLAKNPADRPASLPSAVAALEGGALPARHGRSRRLWIGAGVAIAVAGALTAAAFMKRGVTRAGRPVTSTPDWSIRPAAWPDDDLHPLDAAVSADGESLIFLRADYTLWQSRFDAQAGEAPTPVEVADPASIRAISVAPDGRLLISRQEPDGEWISLEDGSGRTRVTSGGYARAGPDGIIALARGGEVYVRTLASQDERLVASVGGDVYGFAWSPDGARLGWIRQVPGNDARVEIVDLGDGVVRPVKGVLRTGYRELPFAFADASTIVYCGGERRVQALSLETGNARAIASLAPAASACLIAARGERIVVLSGVVELWAAELTLDAPDRGWQRIARGGVEDFTAGGELVVAAWPWTSPPRHRTLYSKYQLPALTVHAIEGGDPTALPSCPGAHRALRRGDRILQAVTAPRDGALAMQLVDPDDCDAVDTWTLPDVPDWMFPRCGGTLCATARVENDALWVWTLHPGERDARELARLPLSPSNHSRWPDLAVAPDGRSIAVVVNGGDAIYLLDASREGGAPRTLDAAPGQDAEPPGGFAATVTWAADSRAVYVTGTNGPLSTLRRVTIDGDSSMVASAPGVNRGAWPRTSPDGARLGANLVDIGVEMLVLDRRAR
jgi:hypothetical protein